MKITKRIVASSDTEPVIDIKDFDPIENDRYRGKVIVNPNVYLYIKWSGISVTDLYERISQNPLTYRIKNLDTGASVDVELDYDPSIFNTADGVRFRSSSIENLEMIKDLYNASEAQITSEDGKLRCYCLFRAMQ